MLSQLPAVKEATDCSAETLAEHLRSNPTQPIVFRGLVNDWPFVIAAKESTPSAVQYLQEFSQPMQVGVGRIPKKASGRLFYNDEFNGFNFERSSEQFSDFITKILSASSDGDDDGHYMGSTSVDRLMPTFRQFNDVNALQGKSPLASIWISNQTQIATHQDLPDNIACCVAGKRRFTLFPPEQIENLYIGPLDLTPAGQPISLVDLNNPDFVQFPKFKNALKNAQVAELDAGDALFIPSLWWHNVESLNSFNVLINYWWQDNSQTSGAPLDALAHAMMNIGSMTTEQKQAIKHLFDFYVFNDDEHALDHIPHHARGILDKHSELSNRKIRAMLLNKLNR